MSGEVVGTLAALMLPELPAGAVVLDQDPRRKPEPERCPCCGRAMKEKK